MEHLTNIIAHKIGSSLGHTDEQIEIVAYGLFGIIQSIFLLVVLVLLGALSGTLFPTMVAFFGGAVLRRRAGGAHASSPMICNIISVVTCFGIGLVSRYILLNFEENTLLSAEIVVYLTCIYIVFARAPLDSPNKPITTPGKRKTLKGASLIIVAVYLIIGSAAILLSEHPVIVSCAISLWLATVWQSFTLTQIGVRVLGLADNTLSAILAKRR